MKTKPKLISVLVRLDRVVTARLDSMAEKIGVTKPVLSQVLIGLEVLRLMRAEREIKARMLLAEVREHLKAPMSSKLRLGLYGRITALLKDNS